MVRASFDSMDFLSLENMPGRRGVEMGGEDDRTPFKSRASLLAVPGRSCWPAPVDGLATQAEPCISRKGYRCQQNVPDTDNNQASGPSKGKTGGAAAARGDETKGDQGSGRPLAGSERTLLDKPLEELTDEDIQQLTREDCRRYLKERGMRRPSWNKSQAIQQVLSLKGLFDSKSDDKRKLTTHTAPKSSSPERLSAESSETSEAQKASPARARQPLPSLVQQGLVSQASASPKEQPMASKQQPMAAMSQLSLPSFGHQALSSQKVETLRDIAGRVHESCTSSSWAPHRQGSMDVQLARQLSQNSQQSSHFGANTDINAVRQPTGFAPPLPSSNRFSKSLPASACPQDRVLSRAFQQHIDGRLPLQGLHSQLVSAVGIGTSNVTAKQPTAQLTIFYSGMVNVYDDVSADKAQTIMLLAGSGKSWSSCSLSSLPPGTVVTKHPYAAAFHTPAHTAGAMAAAYNSNKIDCHMSPAAIPVISRSAKQQATDATQSDHQPSRQASLQRFLEKRKERVRSKAPYPTSKRLVTDTISQLDLSSHVEFHRRSSAATLPVHLPLRVSGQRSTQSSGSETSSPTRLSEAPGQTNSSDEQGLSAGKRPASPKPSPEEKPCEMELSSPSEQNSS